MSPALWSAGRRSAPLAAALVATLALAAGPSVERTLFKDLPTTEPVRAVVKAILDLPLDRVRRGFTEREWTGEGFGGAWERAGRYFPDRAYLVRPGIYFMTHGFDPDGRLFMEIHESDYLALSVEAFRTFAPGAVVEAYGRERAAAGPGAAAFGEKMGRLEPFFRDEGSQRRLRDALGDALHRRLLAELQEENFHMLVGGLVHEGLHADIGDDTVTRLQAEFRSGGQPVQWDELRSFMAEAVYHARFCRWTRDDVAATGRRIEAALRELEPLRRSANLRPGRDRIRFERGQARAWAFAALVRLRMRESWQSARRAESLVDRFREQYVRGDPPADAAGLLASLDRDTAAFAGAHGRAVQAAELALRSLEETLDLWTEWAEGRRPFPPPVTDSIKVVGRLAAVDWPAPPAEDLLALMRQAKAALGTATRS